MRAIVAALMLGPVQARGSIGVDVARGARAKPKSRGVVYIVGMNLEWALLVRRFCVYNTVGTVQSAFDAWGFLYLFCDDCLCPPLAFQLVFCTIHIAISMICYHVLSLRAIYRLSAFCHSLLVTTLGVPIHSHQRVAECACVSA